MLVGYGNNNVLLIVMTAKNVDELSIGLTQTFSFAGYFNEGLSKPVRDIVVMYARDKVHALEQLRASGVAVTEAQIQDYLAWRRTDTPTTPS